jgi:hypothetical protein
MHKVGGYHTKKIDSVGELNFHKMRYNGECLKMYKYFLDILKHVPIIMQANYDHSLRIAFVHVLCMST